MMSARPNGSSGDILELQRRLSSKQLAAMHADSPGGGNMGGLEGGAAHGSAASQPQVVLYLFGLPS
jgi:hypothetical protein